MLEMKHLPQPETMLTYASILEKPKYQVDEKTGIKYRLATGEIVEAACAALRYCAKVVFEARLLKALRLPKAKGSYSTPAIPSRKA